MNNPTTIADPSGLTWSRSFAGVGGRAVPLELTDLVVVPAIAQAAFSSRFLK